MKNKEWVVLVVDDEKELVDNLVNELNKNGYSAIPAYDREQALDCLHQNEIDFLLTDVVFPNGGGIQLVHEMQKIISYSPKVIFFTGSVDQKLKISSEHQLLQKPFSLERLLKLLKSLEKNEEKNNDWVLINIQDFSGIESAINFEGKEYLIPVKVYEIKVDSMLLEMEFHGDVLAPVSGARVILHMRGDSKNNQLNIEVNGTLDTVVKARHGYYALTLKTKGQGGNVLKKIDHWFENRQNQISKFIKIVNGK